MYKDTIYYFNVSFKRPTKWFLRFFGSPKRKFILVPLSADETSKHAEGFEVVSPSSRQDVSRVYIDNVSQLWALQGLVLKCLEMVRGKPEEDDSGDQLE